MSMDIFDFSHYLIKRYDFQLFDAIIVAGAVLNNSSILFTEDMCHNQLIERKLRIVNPFK